MKFFSYESCYLNLLWFVCSIPIVTIGASTTALYYAALKVVRDEDSHVGAAFFRSFRQNFKQATVLWLILLGVGLFLGADGYILYHLRQTSSGTMAVMWTLILAMVIAVGVLYVIVLEAMLKNAFLLGTHYLFATILVFAVHFAMFFVVVAWFTPLIIFGEGLCAVISAWLLSSILIASSGTPEERDALPEADGSAPGDEGETP